MPWIYAHYRFGAAIRSAMPADLRRTVNRFRQLYDMGLHGPDIFAFYNPIGRGRRAGLSAKLHKQSGADCFQRCCRNLRLEPNEAAEAYLYGLLTHYCLDRLCSPFLTEQLAQGLPSVAEAETEFDRYLLERDGKCPPCSQDLSPHIRLTPGECETVSRFYPGVSASHVRDSVRNMALVTKVLATPEGPRRSLLRKSLELTPGAGKARIMSNAPDPNCQALNQPLWELYRIAEQDFPSLLLQLNAHLTYNAPLGADFEPPFAP